MVTLTEKGEKLEKFIEEKLVEIRKEYVKLFSKIEGKDIVFILDIKHNKRSFMRFVNEP